MKKAMKKIVALALSSMTALSVFAASASAAQIGYWCNYCEKTHTLSDYNYWKHHDWYYDGYYYGYYSKITLTAKEYPGGEITATVPSGVENVTFDWTNLYNVKTTTDSSISKIRNNSDGEYYSATCTAKFTYKVNGRTIYDSATATITGVVDGNKCYYDTNIENGYGKYWHDDWYWNNYPWYDNDYWYPPYSYRDEYTVDWSTDTYYYDGEKHVPTATVTVGKRTIELNVSLTSGNGIDVGKHRVVARVPAGYSGIKLDGASLYYNIEEPLKSGFVYEDGYTYYYEGGKPVTGWKTISGDTYYFANDGKATKGWKWLNNAWYYFGSDGKMMTEWVRDGGKIYYCYDSGVMAKSTWLKLDGYWYYFYNDGRMAESEWVLSGGKWYFLAGDGRMATNTTIPGGYYVDSTGAWVK